MLALLDQPQELAGQVLTQLAVTPKDTSAKLRDRLGAGTSRPDGSLGVAPQTKRLLELAHMIAKSLGHNYAKTEHLLIAATSSRLHSPAGSLLADCGAPPEAIREALARALLHEAAELADRLNNPSLFSRFRMRAI